MNLAFALYDYFPFGGLQRDCLKIATVCSQRGHSVTIFARSWEGEKASGLRIELLGRRGLTNASRNRHFISELNQRLKAGSFHGVIGFNKVPGLDVYYGADPCYAAKVRRLKPAWYRWLPRPRLQLASEASVFARGNRTQILLLTSRDIPAYQEHYGTEPERFHILPPGITAHRHDEARRSQARARFREELGASPEARLLLFVGSGFRIKGLNRAIEAFASLPTALGGHSHLVVIGDGDPAPFHRQANKAGVLPRIHFLGGRHDVYDWLLAADVLIHPAYSESAGMVLVEAMVAGLPVLTTDACGYAFHVIKADAGTVLPSPFSQAGCNRALAQMLNSTGSEQSRQNGLAYAAREDLYSCHQRAAEIIEQQVGR